MRVLVLNCGGSSVKFSLFEMPAEIEIAKGSVDKIGGPGAVSNFWLQGEDKVSRSLSVKNHEEAIRHILKLLQPLLAEMPVGAVGHRVVHGGDRFTGTVRINSEVLEVLHACSQLAPLHNPPAIKGIEACLAVLPEIPQIAVFDNAYHQDLPPAAFLYALPYEFYEKYRFRRYGFHGLAFASMTAQASALVGVAREKLRIVSLMLGSGTTANATMYGRSVEVSTGFTPAEGLVQSTRCGDVDPAMLIHIMRELQLNPGEMDEIIYKKSGWLGLSGISVDMEELERSAAQGNSRARLAIEVFVHRAKKYVGAYAAVMGGLDVLVFGGGVGENSPFIRRLICTGLEFLGIILDDSKNREIKYGLVSAPSSRVKVVVVPVREDIVIARETARLAKGLPVSGGESCRFEKG